MSSWSQALSLLGIWLYKQRSGAMSLFPARQQHQLCSWLPFPSIITPLAGTVNPLPCLVAAALIIPVLIHRICFTWALLRTLCWCCACPAVLGAVQGQREAPTEAPSWGTCLSHSCPCCRGAWAPCLRTFQDMYHPPLLHLPCSWLIQAAQGAGNSSQINPSSPALIFS